MVVKFLVFSGIDGSGKTTFSRLLEKMLKSRGCVTLYVWFRWNSYFSYPLLLLFKFLGYTHRIHIRRDSNIYEIILRTYYQCKPLAILWLVFQSLDMFLRYLLIRLRGLNRSLLVICDRFIVPDKLVDLMYETHLVATKNLIVRALVLFFLIRLREGDITIVYLSTDPETAIHRKKDISSRTYIQFYSRVYDNIMRLLREFAPNNVITLNTSTQSVSHNFRLLLTYLNLNKNLSCYK